MINPCKRNPTGRVGDVQKSYERLHDISLSFSLCLSIDSWAKARAILDTGSSSVKTIESRSGFVLRLIVGADPVVLLGFPYIEGIIISTLPINKIVSKEIVVQFWIEIVFSFYPYKSITL